MALAFREQSTNYVAAEEAAKAAGVCMWRGEFEAPWDWLDQERYGGRGPPPIRARGGPRRVKILLTCALLLFVAGNAAAHTTGIARVTEGDMLVVGGKNLNELIVRFGWTLARRRQSNDYVDAEQAAKRDKIGLRQGDFVLPWIWRDDNGIFAEWPWRLAALGQVSPQAAGPMRAFRRSALFQMLSISNT